MTFGQFATIVLFVYLAYYAVVVGYTLLVAPGGGKKDSSAEYTVPDLTGAAEDNEEKIGEAGMSEYARSALDKKKS